MAEILASFPSARNDARVIAGVGNNDDAAVVAIPEGKAIVQTVDFFTPILDDPYNFGRIAAANALSDVYVMGAQVWCAMNLVMFPTNTLPLEILKAILQGGYDVVTEAGGIIVGGHSIEDTSVKYGLCVTGVIDPVHVADNASLCVGDILILTKPLGSGILASAIKNALPQAAACEKELIHWATKLNKSASEVIRTCSVKACTDITGFGLAGHLLEMAQASDVTVVIDTLALPAMEGVWALLEEGYYPRGSQRNRDYAALYTKPIASSVPENRVQLAFDAQTSGGALFAVPEKNVKKVQEVLAEYGDMGYIVGCVEEKMQEGYYLSFL